MKWFRLFAIPLCTCFVVIGSLSPAHSAESETEQLIEEGQRDYRDGKWRAAHRSFDEAYNKADAESPAKAQAALERANLFWQQGDYARAESYVDRALDLARTLGLDGAIGQLLLTRGHIEASQGRLESGEETLEICIQLSEEEGDQMHASLCKLNHRLVRQLQGKPTSPDTEYEEAIEELEADGSALSVGTSLSKTAELYGKSGDSARALELYRKAQAKFEESGSVPAQLRNRLRIARHLQEEERWDRARQHLDGLEDRFDSMNSRPALIDALTLTAADAQQQGRLDEARNRFERALTVAEETNSTSLISRSHLALCEFGLQADQFSAARQHCARAAEGFEEVGIPDLAARSHSQVASLYHAQRDFNRASTHYSKAIKRIEATGQGDNAHKISLSNYRANLCQVEMNLASNGAHYLCKKALEELDSLEEADPSMVAATYYAVGVTAKRDGQPHRSLEHLEKAAELATSEELDQPKLAAEAHLRRGVLLADDDARLDEAADAFEEGLDLVREEGDQQLESTGLQLKIQLAQLELARENWQRARPLLEHLLEETAGSAETQAWAYHALASVELARGAPEKAREALQEALPRAKTAGDDELVEAIEEKLEELE